MKRVEQEQIRVNNYLLDVLATPRRNSHRKKQDNNRRRNI